MMEVENLAPKPRDNPAKRTQIRVCGFSVESEFPIAGVRPDEAGLATALTADVQVLVGSEAQFSKIRGRLSKELQDWFTSRELETGAWYIRWTGLFEFLVSSDGRTIWGLPEGSFEPESFQTYLLNQVLSFSAIKLGFEPIHATVCQRGSRCFALLGDSGYGKSTLGASFLRDDYRILTDDLLVLKRSGSESDSRFIVAPGMPRIKLFPSAAAEVLGIPASDSRMNSRVNPGTEKMIFPLAHEAIQARAALSGIVVLAAPEEGAGLGGRIELKALSKYEAFQAILKNTFNTIDASSPRLRRQFEFVQALCTRVPVIQVNYHRSFSNLERVKRVIEEAVCLNA